ncbi:MBL fold metallo-hydrolase [Corynebacterium sp. A21]|uniref:MBL fold metallo-hydrolase n=1 Tax=Corynebacterium sp. A21 TaxID=3457318 RepID=UPI003FD461B1
MNPEVPVRTLFAPWGRFGLYTFLIDAPELTIVDTGVTATVEGVVAGLIKLGRSIEDVKWILLTHGHIDHLGGTQALWEMTGRRAKVVIHEADLHYLQSRRAHVDNYLGVRSRYIDNPDAEAQQTEMMAGAISGEMDAQVVVRGGETLDLGGGVRISVHNVPGHTAGSVAYEIQGQRDVFVGDAVQIHGAANGFPGYEDPDAYRDSLELLRDVLKPSRMFLGHPFRGADGIAHEVELDRGTSVRVLDEALEIEAKVRAVAGSLEPKEIVSPYSPFEAVAAALGYEGDPTLEPSPFFTTMDGYRRLFGR